MAPKVHPSPVRRLAAVKPAPLLGDEAATGSCSAAIVEGIGEPCGKRVNLTCEG